MRMKYTRTTNEKEQQNKNIAIESDTSFTNLFFLND